VFRYLNKTKTSLGAALLRSNLRQPLCNVNSIRERQDAVKELIENEGLMDEVRSSLAQLPRDPDTYVDMVMRCFHFLRVFRDGI